MKLNQVISGSELATFKRCRRIWYYTYVHNQLAPKPEAMQLGIDVHQELEDYYTTGIVPEGDTKQAKMVRAWSKSEAERELLEITGNFVEAELEKEVFLKLSDNVGIRGKLDVYLPNDPTILDWKTSSALWEPEQVFRSDQLRTYSLAIWELTGTIPKVYAQSIRSVDPGHKASKPPFYKLVTLPEHLAPEGRFPQGLLERHKVRLTEEAEELIRTKELAKDGVRVDRPTFSRDCNRCAFSDACDIAVYGDPVAEWAALSIRTTKGDPNERYDA